MCIVRCQVGRVISFSRVVRACVLSPCGGENSDHKNHTKITFSYRSDMFCMAASKRCQLGTSPLGYMPELPALKGQSTPHGPYPGPAREPWCTRRPPACPAAGSTINDPRPKEKKGRSAKKSIWHIVIFVYVCVFVHLTRVHLISFYLTCCLVFRV